MTLLHHDIIAINLWWLISTLLWQAWALLIIANAHVFEIGLEVLIERCIQITTLMAVSTHFLVMIHTVVLMNFCFLLMVSSTRLFNWLLKFISHLFLLLHIAFALFFFMFGIFYRIFFVDVELKRKSVDGVVPNKSKQWP